jgi:hypothetical protein
VSSSPSWSTWLFRGHKARLRQYQHPKWTEDTLSPASIEEVRPVHIRLDR